VLPRIFPGGPARNYAYRLVVKPLKTIFLDHPIEFSLEEQFFKLVLIIIINIWYISFLSAI
jgi:hypothetical protein